MSDGFSYQEIMSLQNILNYNQTEDEVSENQFYSGKTESVLNPGNVMNSRSGEKKEVAQPYAKIETKINNRLPSKIPTDIWKDEELREENIKEDGRPKPQFEILYKQSVTTEDLYLGLSGKSNSSLSCEHLLMKIWLPNTHLKEIGLELKEQSVHLQTPNYLLNHILPYSIEKDKSDAKWDKDKGLLQVTLKVLKKEVVDELFQQKDN
jgi:hypothetical protein